MSVKTEDILLHSCCGPCSVSCVEPIRQEGKEPVLFPKETAIGALALYVSDERIENFQPMNVNFSIISPLEQRIRKKAEKNLAIANRSLAIIDAMKEQGI